MRPSIPLNTERLKYYREQRNFTQSALAVAVHVSLRYYQRIEETARTSPLTAKRLARALGVKIEDLTSAKPISQDDTAIDLVWIESVAYGFGGRLTHFSAGLKELDEWLVEAAKRLMRESEGTDPPKLMVRIGTEGIAFRLHLPSRPVSDPYQKLRQSFVLRAAIKEPEGINWISFKQNDLHWLVPHVWLAAGNCSYELEFNGQNFPQTDDCPYAVVLRDEIPRALDYGPPEPDFQFFETERDLFRAFRRLTPTSNGGAVSASLLLGCKLADPWSVRLTNLPGRLSRKHIEILRVERLSDGTVRRIPWPLSAREYVASFIRSNKGLIVVFDGEPDVVFAPNLLAGGVLVGEKDRAAIVLDAMSQDLEVRFVTEFV